jgi:hypothetical protein
LKAAVIAVLIAVALVAIGVSSWRGLNDRLDEAERVERQVEARLGPSIEAVCGEVDGEWLCHLRDNTKRTVAFGCKVTHDSRGAVRFDAARCRP